MVNYLVITTHTNCAISGCDDTAWDCCAAIDSVWDGRTSKIAFDHTGTPWIVSHDPDIWEINIAKMKMPPNELIRQTPATFGDRNSPDANGQHRLTPGVSPCATAYGVCTDSADKRAYCGGYTNDGNYDSIETKAYEGPVYNFATKYASNSNLPTVRLQFKTDVNPATKNVVLQAYRFGTTNAWETVSTYSSAGCSTDNCNITAEPSGTISEYFEADGSDYWIYFRLYQVESMSAIEFKLDSFCADIVQPSLRHGGVFREEGLHSFSWQVL